MRQNASADETRLRARDKVVEVFMVDDGRCTFSTRSGDDQQHILVHRLYAFRTEDMVL
jgi:hypothetical protein